MFNKLIKNFYYLEKQFFNVESTYITIFFKKIEKTAFWFEDVLAKRTRNIN